MRKFKFKRIETEHSKHLPQIVTSPAAAIEFGAHCDNDNKIPGILRSESV